MRPRLAFLLALVACADQGPRIDGWEHVLLRMRLGRSSDAPYEASYQRKYRMRAGQEISLVLVDAPDRELELAEALFEQGFVRQGVYHAKKILAYHPNSAEAGRARRIVEASATRSVFSEIEGLKDFFVDGERYFFPIPPAKAALSSVDIADLESGRLAEIASRHPGTPVAFALHYRLALESEGEASARHFREALGVVQIPALPIAAPPAMPLDRSGFVGTLRLESEPLENEPPRDAIERRGIPADDQVSPPTEEPAIFFPEKERTLYVRKRGRPRETPPAGWIFYEARFGGLFENERAYKRRFLADAAKVLGPSEELARARIYYGLDQDLRPIVREKIDEEYERRLAENSYLKIEAGSIVTAGPTLPLGVASANISSIRFRFARVPGGWPADEAGLKKFLDEKRTAPLEQSFEENLAARTRLDLPIRKPGVYRVTAQAKDLECVFFAVRTEARAEALFFPAETVFLTNLPGLAISLYGKTVGTTDANGVLRIGPLRARYCPEHVECCRGCCESCAHHHQGSDWIAAKDALGIFGSGPGTFFRASCRANLDALIKVSPPPLAPILYVYTDRPVYRAGDTLRFRGILRAPRPKISQGDDARFDPSPNRDVTVAILRDKVTVFSRKYVTGEFGTFSGDWTLLLSANRAEYSLEVDCDGTRSEAKFEVMDYRKNDFTVQLTPEADGVRVKAGYAWGEPVPGSALVVTVDGKETAVPSGVVPARAGQVVKVVLKRGEEELTSKTVMIRGSGPKSAEESRGQDGASGERKETKPVSAAGSISASPALRANRPRYSRGDEIELELAGPDGEALVVLGDVQAYDWRRVEVKNGRGSAKFPALGVLDPGTTAFALFGERIEQLPIAVSAHRMPIEISREKERAGPGEEIGLAVRSRPRAELSIGAVDEAIYMLREDDTPELYGTFYRPRPAVMAHGTFGEFRFDGETREAEHPPVGPMIRLGRMDGEPFLSRAYDTIGVGGGGGGGGRYGGRFGGVARGGGARATESAVLSGLGTLAGLQAADGSWGPSEVSAEWGRVGQIGNTGLALLAFLGAGYTHLSKDQFNGRSMGDIVQRGLQYLVGRQQSDGSLGQREGDWLLDHALASIALSEAYGMTASPILKDPAARAVAWFCSRQGNDGGWHPSAGDSSETAISALGVLLLDSARLSELSFPPSSAVAAGRYFGAVMKSDGASSASRLPVAPSTLLTNAGGLLSRLLLHRNKEDPRLVAAALKLSSNPPSQGLGTVGVWMGLLALYQWDGPDGALFRRWNEVVKGMPRPKGSTIETSVALLTLEVHYRYASVFGAREGRGEAPPLAPAPAIRIHFPDTALWIPDLVTDDKGEANVRLKLPDSITTLRLTARGATRDGSLGEATSRIESMKPFFVNLKTPEFFVVGDEPVIRAEVFNYMGARLDAAVTLSGDGFRLLDASKREISAGSDPVHLSWRVRVEDPARVRFVVDAGRDAAEKTVQVRPPESPVTRFGRGPKIELREGEVPLELAVRLTPRGSALWKVLAALRYLSGYPHG